MTSDTHARLATAPAASTSTLIARFAERAGALGVKIHRVTTADEIAAVAAALAAEAGDEANGVVIAGGLDAAQPALRERLAARGARLEALDAGDPGPVFARVAVGISEAVAGVAETGTLVVADPPDDRLARMLSPKHIAVLDARAIVASLDEAGERLRALVGGADGARANYITFITGPSRTADIEMSLTVGAHGPAELHVAILGAAPAG